MLPLPKITLEEPLRFLPLRNTHKPAMAKRGAFAEALEKKPARQDGERAKRSRSCWRLVAGGRLHVTAELHRHVIGNFAAACAKRERDKAKSKDCKFHQTSP